MHDPEYKKKIEESKGPNFELEAKTINVGNGVYWEMELGEGK